MSTVCKICVSKPEVEVAAALEEILAASEDTFHRTSTEWPASNEPNEFIPDDIDPTLLSLKLTANDVSEIHFNTFGKVRELASNLSSKLSTGVVVLQYQSVACASYWAFHLHGELLREIEAGDHEVSSQTGKPLAFEGKHPGRDVSEEGEPACYAFGSEDMDFYNSEVGIPVEVYQEFDAGWHNFASENHEQRRPVEPPPRGKPWWKFW